MRKALLVFVICMLAAPAWAGGGFSLFASYSELTEDVSATGFGLRATFGSEHVVGDLTWTWFPSNDDVDTVAGYQDNLQVIPTDLGVRFLFNTSGSFIPYIGAGGTFFYANLNDGNIDNTVGYYGLLGFNAGGGKAKIFAEVIYRYGKADFSYRHATDPIQGELELGGGGVNAGVIWTF